MEWIAPFIIGILVVSTVFQLLMAHSVSVIARKNDLGSMMEVFAWIPLIQLMPMLAIGGGSIGRFLLGVVTLILGNVAVAAAAATLGDGLGTALGAIALVFTLVICFGYYTRILWNTATSRGLSGWVGVLMFVPIANLFVYPYIAFHDGWGRPHTAGMILGTLITVGSTLPYVQVVHMLENDENFKSNLARLANGGDLRDMDGLENALAEMDGMEPEARIQAGPAPTAQPDAPPADGGAEVAQAHERSIRALFDLKGRFEALDSLASPENMKIQDNRVRALNQIRRLRSDLERRRVDIDDKTYEELASHLNRVEARVHGRVGGPSSSQVTMAQNGRVFMPSGGSGATPPASAGNLDRDAAPLRPFPVVVAETCPHGTELRTRTSEKGEEEWCQQLSSSGGLRHGWYARYFEAGQPEQVGEYRDGLRVGVWTRFHRSGEVRAQAEFDQGLQHGWLLSFDTSGERQKAVRFDRGAAVE